MFKTIAYLLGHSRALPAYFRLPEVYKAVRVKNQRGNLVDYAIAVLEIPAGTPRYQASMFESEEFKCRTSHARVLRFEGLSGVPLDVKVGYSLAQMSFEYKPGEIVTPRQGYDYTKQTCAGGIHFFRKRQDAVNYANL